MSSVNRLCISKRNRKLFLKCSLIVMGVFIIWTFRKRTISKEAAEQSSISYQTILPERSEILFDNNNLQRVSQGHCTIIKVINQHEKALIASVSAILKSPIGDITIETYGKQDLISHDLITKGVWEADIMSCISDILKSDAQLQFIDLGAFLGIYTIVAAKQGRQVISVDANENNLLLVHQSLQKNQLTNRVVLINNAINNHREYVSMNLLPQNLGGSNVVENTEHAKSQQNKVKSILLDDLLEVITFKRAVVKMDLEGKEYEAIRNGEQFFTKLDIPFVAMEWSIPKFADSQKKGKFIFEFMKRMGYRAYKSGWRVDVLLDDNYLTWPSDIFWVRT